MWTAELPVPGNPHLHGHSLYVCVPSHGLKNINSHLLALGCDFILSLKTLGALIQRFGVQCDQDADDTPQYIFISSKLGYGRVWRPEWTGREQFPSLEVG